MRLTVPPLKIGEDEGFSGGKDIFNRKEFGERLATLIENTDGELVIALDADWGEGKSTFIKMWRGYLKKKDNGIHTIYFDAFENDHQSSPFLALASEIYSLLNEDEDEKAKFKAKTLGALKTAGRITLRTGIKALSAGVLDETILEKGTAGDISKEMSDAVDRYITDRLNAAAADKRNIEDFKKYLEDLPKKLSYNGKSIIFIIDELDRCKPPFALEIVEVVKHLFAVPNITFVLVMNKNQLEASVGNEYGTDEPSKYLQKFINLWVSLPKNKEPARSDVQTYFSECVKRMEMEAKRPFEYEWMEKFKELVVYYNLSLREIERCLTNFAFIRTGLDNDININHRYQWITAYLCIIKVRHPDVYSELIAPGIEYAALVTRTELTELEDDWTLEEKRTESHYLKWLLRYYLANDEQAKELLSQANHLNGVVSSGRRTVIRGICDWLDSFRMS